MTKPASIPTSLSGVARRPFSASPVRPTRRRQRLRHGLVRDHFSNAMPGAEPRCSSATRCVVVAQHTSAAALALVNGKHVRNPPCCQGPDHARPVWAVASGERRRRFESTHSLGFESAVPARFETAGGGVQIIKGSRRERTPSKGRVTGGGDQLAGSARRSDHDRGGGERRPAAESQYADDRTHLRLRRDPPKLDALAGHRERGGATGRDHGVVPGMPASPTPTSGGRARRHMLAIRLDMSAMSKDDAAPSGDWAPCDPERSARSSDPPANGVDASPCRAGERHVRAASRLLARRLTSRRIGRADRSGPVDCPRTTDDAVRPPGWSAPARLDDTRHRLPL